MKRFLFLNFLPPPPPPLLYNPYPQKFTSKKKLKEMVVNCEKDFVSLDTCKMVFSQYKKQHKVCSLIHILLPPVQPRTGSGIIKCRAIFFLQIIRNRSGHVALFFNLVHDWFNFF